MHARLCTSLFAVGAIAAVSMPAYAGDAAAPSATLTDAPASAPSTYLALTGSVATDEFISADVGAEVGARIARRIWGHLSYRQGGNLDAEGGGEHFEVRTGIDYERCTASGGLCGLAGIDLGYQSSTWQKDGITESHGGPFLAPHLGLDAGGDHLRFRLIAEARGYVDRASERGTRFEPGLGISAAMAYRF
ncbi:MAG: hypothetical protein K8W52_35830 [Deltaproteobacteria bacterium]|nr:hypothetical protein [Deltaproteobacteria bacterium]